MAGPILLVPGTLASSLFDDDGAAVWNAVRATIGLSRDELGGRPPSQWIPLLSMEHAPGQWAPVRTSLETDTRLSADLVVQTPYDRLWGMIDDVFPYDWRCDIRHNARLLNDYLAAHPAPAGQRWTLVGHSQGCLVIIAASKLEASPSDFGARVQRVVLVAPPTAGTMKAATPLLFGLPDLGTANLAKTRTLMRTWPALYQMLPSWNCVLDADGAPRPMGEQLTRPGGWPDTSDVSDAVLGDMLDRARELQSLIVGPFSYMGPWVDARVVMGESQPTPITIERNDDLLLEESATSQPGDSLVPLGRTVAWGGVPFGTHVTALEGAREHAMLCEDEDVLTLIRRWVRSEAPPAPVV